MNSSPSYIIFRSIIPLNSNLNNGSISFGDIYIIGFDFSNRKLNFQYDS